MQYLFLAVIAFIILGLVIAAIRKSQSDQQARLRELLPNPGQPPTMEDVKRLARAGEKIMAIKLYRKIRNVGLKEAKDEVERMASGGEAINR